MSPPSTIQALCRANLGILRQKLNLMQVLKTDFGNPKAKAMYQQMCPVVQASVGQHIRHSMDHLDLVAANLLAAAGQPSGTTTELHYDLRKRGGDDEHDIDQAQERIEKVAQMLIDIAEITHEENKEVQACFMLSGDPQEFQLPSTIEREMGFAAHHAIHHMAMVKIIAVQTLGISKESFSPDFGRAPSTMVHDKSLSSDQTTPR